MVKEYVAVTYSTYNFRNIFTAAIVLFLYYFFITKLFVAIKYEVLNTRNQCDVRYYYGRGCRNKISESILLDPRFLDYKSKYFDTVNAKITPTLDTNGVFMDAENRNIDLNEKKHEASIEKAKGDFVSQFKKVSDALHSMIGSVLGNIKGILNLSFE
jgi:hypothetical protein